MFKDTRNLSGVDGIGSEIASSDLGIPRPWSTPSASAKAAVVWSPHRDGANRNRRGE